MLRSAIAALTGKSVETKVLEIDLARGVVSAPPDNPLAALRLINAASMNALREGLRHAATDDQVAGLVVRVTEHPSLALAQLQELGELVAEFDRHKPTVAFAESFGEAGSALSSYTLATHCRQIWLQPSGELGLTGVHVGITLLRGLLEKGGVEPQFAQRHEYKSAGEQFSAHQISDANREMMQRLADSIFEQSVERISARRGVDAESVRALIDRGLLTPEEALAGGLIDRIGYRDEMFTEVWSSWGAKAKDEKALQFVHRYEAAHAGPRRARQTLDRAAPQVGVVTLRGPIVTGRGRPAQGGQGQAGADVICEQLRAAGRNDRIKAVVLRIDSPGGSAVASDSIWRAVTQLRASGRPVVAQMGALAASGGYYSAVGADAIVALPATLTGSIGVVAGKFVLEQTYRKLGLVHEGLGAGRQADFFAADAPWNQEQWDLLNGFLDRIYADFVAKAAQGRGMGVEELEPLARGRVWTGADAHQRGLVDQLGGLEVALQKACDLASINRDRAQVHQLPALGLFDRLQPANNSESVSASASALTELGLGASGPDALLQRGLRFLGLTNTSLPTDQVGVLTMPWQLTIR